VDHQEAGAPMSGRGRGWLAVALAALVVVGGVAAQRSGAAAVPDATQGSAVSSSWLCPHGGGNGWQGDVVIANPGASEVDARLTSLGGEHPRVLNEVTVPPGEEVVREVPADVRAAATRVDVFGGWAGVGWVVHAGGDDAGLGAEPCTEHAGAAWGVIDGVTNRQTRSYLVVMNPFAADAVVDVVLYLPDHPPVRDTAWTDLRIRAGTSTALDLRRALGEPIVGATVTATRGRIAVSSLAVGAHGGVRSALAQPAFASRWIAPVAGGSGSGTVSLFVPGDLGIRFGATQLSADTAPQPAGNLTVVRQGGASAISAPLQTVGPSAVVVEVLADAQTAVGLRESGKGGDDAATSGTAAAGPAWLVLPAALGPTARSTLVLANDGAGPVQATLRQLSGPDGEAAAPITITIPPGRTATPPRSWLDTDPTAAVLVTADGALVALGAGTTGNDQTNGYAMGLGVPAPAGVSAAP